MRQTGSKIPFYTFIAFALLCIVAGMIFYAARLFNGGNVSAPPPPLGREREISDQKILENPVDKPTAFDDNNVPAPLQFRERKSDAKSVDGTSTFTIASSSSREGNHVPGEIRSLDGNISHPDGSNAVSNIADENVEENATPLPTQTPASAALVYGTVTDQNGVALENIRIVVTGISQAKSVGSLTDSSGVYKIEMPITGQLEIHAIPPVDSNLVASTPKIRVLQEGGEIREDFVLKEGEIVEGVVINEKEEPIDEVSIAAIMSVGQKLLTTDSHGYFRVAGIPQGQTVHTLVVSHPDYQTRTLTHLNLLDGFQKIVLKQANNIFLKVIWSLDGSPVEFYAYRLLRKTSYQDIFVQTDRKEIMVETPTGITIIDTLGKATWRVEVTVMSPDKQTTDIKGSSEFILDDGEKGVEVLVAIDQGRNIQGIVVQNEKGGVPVGGATIEFVAPSAGFGRFPPPDKPFLFPTGISDPNGNFRFYAMPPGRYTLKVQKDLFCAPEAIDLIVPYDKDPDPFEIIICEGGSIYGKVIGAEGVPLANARIALSQQRVNADGWIHKETKTDEEGYYEFPGLNAGSHYIWAYDDQTGQKEARSFSLGHGEKKEQNFNFSGLIQLSGMMRINGEPAPQGLSFLFLGENDSHNTWNSVDGEGRYEAFVKSGRLSLRISGPTPTEGEMEPFFIPDAPSIQEMDINMDIVQADVIVQFPQEDQFEDGQVVISPLDRMLRYGFSRVKMHQTNRHVVSIFANTYQATFQSTSGQWHGKTDNIVLGSGKLNAFLIEVKKTVSGVRMGGWVPGQLSMTEPSTLAFDATQALESGGNINILVLFEKGRHAVQPSAVFLFENNVCISRDEHIGWSGADHWNNDYSLNLNALSPGGQYRIEILIRCDGGTDSTGSVYLSLN
ncbi:carboxypeptidase regulatory-like domain-containing protein [Candidatus Sumerlaeota bacterium]|nr:carboxypeptidase regulatory-like domain-containing protein [Candidatus Sumerlaeota bacterium]